MQNRFSPLFANMMVWFPWALWHAPLDYFRPTPWTWVQYALLRVVFLIPFTIILTWFYNRSDRSIQTAALFHTSMNTTPFILPYFPPAFGLVFVWAAYAVIVDRMWRFQLLENSPHNLQPARRFRPAPRDPLISFFQTAKSLLWRSGTSMARQNRMAQRCGLAAFGEDWQNGEKKYRTEIVVRDIVLLGSRENEQKGRGEMPAQQSSPQPAPAVAEDDIPF